MQKRNTSNPKRRMRDRPSSDHEKAQLAEMAERVGYGGNPEHKRDPGDFGLDPPAMPRPGKTLCDGAGVTRRADALRLLREGVRLGLVSVQTRGGWPQNVWAVTETGIPVEAQLENEELGTYHGYPMLVADPLFDVVLARWREA